MKLEFFSIEFFIVALVILFFNYVETVNSDKPCAARQIQGRSVVCVCNATYCDEITREPVGHGYYAIYTSSEDGLRFHKNTKQFEATKKCTDTELILDPSTQYQTIEGFGGAVTDAVGINWKSLPLGAQKNFVDSYFSDRGIEYNMLRVPIAGSDFSTRAYAYNEVPVNDACLFNYTLAYEDYEYKVPLIYEIMTTSKTPVHIVSSVWSPPPWMKSNNLFYGEGYLLQEYYYTYALYHLRFIEAYSTLGIPIWGITTTNEPTDGTYTQFMPYFSNLGWLPSDMGIWIANYLGPLIRSSRFNVKILGNDDGRNYIVEYIDKLIEIVPAAEDYLDGIAVHFYYDSVTPPTILSETQLKYPDKFILYTEACEDVRVSGVELGSWERARHYVMDMIDVLNHEVVGWIDWNLCLDQGGGPNFISNIVDSPVIVDADNGEFVKQPMFYAIGHLSKFVPRGSKRIGMVNPSTMVQSVAFFTTNSTVVVVLYNDANSTTILSLRLGEEQAIVSLPANSIATVELLVPYL